MSFYPASPVATAMGGSQFSCVYEGCDATRTSHQAMKDHVDSVHLKIKKFECSICDYKCSLKQCLTSHLRGIHGQGKEQIPCPYEGCHVRRLSNSAIQLHVDSVHLKIKKHFCHLCQYSCCDSNSLNIHLRGVHDFGGKYTCSFPDCSTKCVTKAALTNHVNNKHLKLHSYHTCSGCGFTTSSIREFRRHICPDRVNKILSNPDLMDPADMSSGQLDGSGISRRKRGRPRKHHPYHELEIKPNVAGHNNLPLFQHFLEQSSAAVKASRVKAEPPENTFRSHH